MKILRASEIGTYLYCQRAWWYQQKGERSENQSELAAGSSLHERHGRAVMLGGCLRIVAYGLLLLAAALITVYLVGRFV